MMPSRCIHCVMVQSRPSRGATGFRDTASMLSPGPLRRGALAYMLSAFERWAAKRLRRPAGGAQPWEKKPTPSVAS